MTVNGPIFFKQCEFLCIFERYFYLISVIVCYRKVFFTLSVLLFVTKVLGTCTWLKKHLMYLMPSKDCKYLNLYLQIWKVLVLDPNPVTHWGQDKMALISQTTFSNAFPWMEIFKFQLRFQVCLKWSNWQYSSIGSDIGLAPNRRQAIIWSNDVLGCRFIYASLGLNELILHYVNSYIIENIYTALCTKTWPWMIPHCHHNDITWASWCLKSPAPQLFVQHLVQANTEET